MARPLRARTALPEDLSRIADANVGQLTTMYDSSSGESDVLFRLSRALLSYAQVCSYAQPQTQIHLFVLKPKTKKRP